MTKENVFRQTTKRNNTWYVCEQSEQNGRAENVSRKRSIKIDRDNNVKKDAPGSTRASRENISFKRLFFLLFLFLFLNRALVLLLVLYRRNWITVPVSLSEINYTNKTLTNGTEQHETTKLCRWWSELTRHSVRATRGNGFRTRLEKASFGCPHMSNSEVKDGDGTNTANERRQWVEWLWRQWWVVVWDFGFSPFLFFCALFLPLFQQSGIVLMHFPISDYDHHSGCLHSRFSNLGTTKKRDG